MSRRARVFGLSLIEVVVFIVVLGVGFAGMLILYNQVTRSSVDPIVRKQALAIANSLLEEVELRPFTYCDPDDANVLTATAPIVGVGNCATLAESAMAPEGGETRYGPNFYDNVNDYNGFAMAGSNPVDPSSIRDLTNAPIPGLNGYIVAVMVTPIAGGELPDVADPAAALRITVTVTAPTGVTVNLQGYRLRYAPNSP
jgi:MSHA pilin protein MshD